MSINPDALKQLRSIPDFTAFARRKMAEDADFWEQERKFGSGIMGVVAVAVCEIGGGD